MEHEPILRTIRDRAGLDSTAAAADAAVATLRTLGEKLSIQEVAVLVESLPGAFARELAAADDGPPQSFGPDEFVGRVHARDAGALDDADAECHVRAVFEALAACLDHDDWRALRLRLAPEYDRLYDDPVPLRLAG